MRVSALLSLLICAACQPSTQTFLVSRLIIPERPEDFGRDLDLDGSIDNDMSSWSTIWRSFGVSTQENTDALLQSGDFNIGLDLIQYTARAELIGYQANSEPGQAFLFDGEDSLTALGGVFWFDSASLDSVEGGAPRLRASTSQFVWGMSLFGELFRLPLEGVEVTGELQGDKIVNGSITGVIRAEDVARMLPELPALLGTLASREASLLSGSAPVACEGSTEGQSATCESISASSFCTDRAGDGVVTGVCVSLNSQTRTFASAFDQDKDGHYAVIRDPETGAFIENELSAIFDSAGFGEPPTGLIGGLFKLDHDNIPDAMGVGVGFEAVPANKTPL